MLAILFIDLRATHPVRLATPRPQLAARERTWGRVTLPSSRGPKRR